MADNHLKAKDKDNDKHNDNDKDRTQEGARWQSLDSDPLDRELDAALARFAAVEPRAGLEERVLASLRAERKRPAPHAWWQWTALAALAAMLLVALTLLWRSGERRRDNVARYPSPAHTMQHSVSNGTQVAANRGRDQMRVSRPVSVRKPRAHIPRQARAVVASRPRLDQFPSPRPLSEQEKILASYVTRYPEHAALVAQARAEVLRQDLADEMKDAGTDSRQ